MSDADSSKPLYESSVKLCAAVKKYKCLYDRISYTKNAPPKCEDAWEMVADECNESVEYCKGRWKALRRCFFDGLKRKGNKYYLHDHLDFLLEGGQKKAIRNSVGSQNDEKNSSISDALKKKSGSLKERDVKRLKIFDDDDVRSFDSQTTSADESNENVSQTAGVFIINELDDTYQAVKDLEEDRRLSFNRSCKRALDPSLIEELADEEPEEKRSRKSDKSFSKQQTAKIRISAHKIESVKDKLVDSSTNTERKLVNDAGTQYDIISTDFDDVFMQSIKNQLQEMNGRQKMNFKRMIYQSMMEVFDDTNDFPNANETLPCTNKQIPSAVNTTVGELRLMRELVSLVQAAKNTPEIINAKEKVKISPPATSKPPVKVPASTAENRTRNKSPLSMSPTPDDDELPFFIDDSDDDEFPLPRSWDEIKAKTAETTKAITAPENTLGLPRRILQKVVRVSGSNGGTIVARDGDKKRIYRIVPKQNPNGNNGTPNKNETNAGRIIVSTTKNLQDTRKESSVGTFYVSNTKITQDMPKLTNTTPNFTIRPVKQPLNNTQQTTNTNTSINNNQTTSSTTSLTKSHNNTNGQTIFKNVHPANRILSSSTGYFKSMSPPQNQKLTTQHSAAAAATNPAKVTSAKMPMSHMLPPAANAVNKRLQAIRQGPQIVQRRFSICGPVPSDQQPPTSTANASKVISAANNANAQAQSAVSRIQISQPVSLNARAVHSISPASTQNVASVHIPEAPAVQRIAKPKETPAPKEEILPVKPIQPAQESFARQQLVVSTKDAVLENTLTQREIPVLETAGIVEADDLDPLFVKAPHVKSEPIDDDE